MKRILFMLTVATVSLQAEIVSLERAVQLAMEKNETVQIASKDLENSRHTYTEAYSGALPVVSASATYLRSLYSSKIDQGPKEVNAVKDNTLSWDVTATQPLYVGGKVGTAIEIADIYSQLNQTAFEIKQADIKAQVMKNFYNVLMAGEALKVTRLVKEDAEKNRDRIEKLYQQGVASEYDFLKAKVRVMSISPKITELVHAEELALSVLKSSMGMKETDKLEIQGEFKEPAAADTVDFGKRVSQNRKELAVLKYQSQMYEKNVKIEFGDYLPTIAALGSYNFKTQNDDLGKSFDKNVGINAVSVGLTAKFPIFNGFATGARVDKARVEVKKSDLLITQTERQLKIQARQAVNKINEAREEIALQNETIVEAEKALKIAETRFASGVGTQLEVIDAQTQLEQARLAKVTAINKLIQANVDFKYAVGEL